MFIILLFCTCLLKEGIPSFFIVTTVFVKFIFQLEILHEYVLSYKIKFYLFSKRQIQNKFLLWKNLSWINIS